MTLIMSVIGERTIQISDRRSTDQNGEWQDNLNKSFVVICEDARVAVSFTGLAVAHEFEANLWIGQAMCEAFQPDLLLEPMLARFADAITCKFAELSLVLDDEKRCLSIVLTGYRYEDGAPIAGIWLVSNYDALDEDEPSDFANSQFKVTCRKEAVDGRCHALACPNGNSAAISDKQFGKLLKLANTGAFEEVLKKTLRLMRFAARSTKSSNTISEECSSIVIPADPGECVRFGYHSPSSAKVSYTPGYLTARKDSGVFFIPEVRVGIGPI